MNEREEFKAIVRALAPYISDTYDLLNAADKVQKAIGPAFGGEPGPGWLHHSDEPPF